MFRYIKWNKTLETIQRTKLSWHTVSLSSAAHTVPNCRRALSSSSAAAAAAAAAGPVAGKGKINKTKVGTTNSETHMSQLVEFCHRRGFVYPGSHIYGGFASSYDYGPLGVQLKKVCVSLCVSHVSMSLCLGVSMCRCLGVSVSSLSCICYLHLSAPLAFVLSLKIWCTHFCTRFNPMRPTIFMFRTLKKHGGKALSTLDATVLVSKAVSS
jgi:hypothetical protein